MISEVCKLIACGCCQSGFRRHTWTDCGTVLVVPFTRNSCLYLLCYRKGIFWWSIHLSHIMNPALAHFRVTFALPGTVCRGLFERGFKPYSLIIEAVNVYWKNLRLGGGNLGKEWYAGIVATIHTCGNGLNWNPHVKPDREHGAGEHGERRG